VIREQRIDEKRRPNEQDINAQENRNEQGAQHQIRETFSSRKNQANTNLNNR
jgi:hypothetical protein